MPRKPEGQTAAARRPKRGRGRGADVSGYRVQVRHRLDARRREGRPHAAAEKLVREAGLWEAHGRFDEAEEALIEADRLLDEGESEQELTERPRGFVGYSPVGDPGVPPGVDEDPLANRILLVGRLLTLARAGGTAVDDLRAELAEAERAFRAGDRAGARARLDPIEVEIDRRREAPK